MMPLVSVILTTYNHALYLEDTLRSVFNQTYRPFEVIVVDDGSTDDTPQRVASFGDKVISIRQPNQGVAASRNAGIASAKGEFVALLDGDDLWEAEKLSVQVAAAQQYAQSGMIVVDGLQVTGSQIIRPSLFCVLDKDFLPADRMIASRRCYQEMLRHCLIGTTSQVMIPRHVLQDIGPSDARITRASDYDLYLRIAAKYDVTFIKQKLTRWRYLDTSVSGPQYMRGLRYTGDRIEVLKKQMTTAPRQYRGAIRQALKEGTYLAGETAYYYGRGTERSLATRHLLKLWRANMTALPLLIFLAGLWLPEAVTRSFGPTVRKILGAQGD